MPEPGQVHVVELLEEQRLPLHGVLEVVPRLYDPQILAKMFLYAYCIHGPRRQLRELDCCGHTTRNVRISILRAKLLKVEGVLEVDDPVTRFQLFFNRLRLLFSLAVEQDILFKQIDLIDY